MLHFRWLFETFGCQAYGVESYTAGYAALGFVIALCIERYCSVRYTEFCKYIYEYGISLLVGQLNKPRRCGVIVNETIIH